MIRFVRLIVFISAVAVSSGTGYAQDGEAPAPPPTSGNSALWGKNGELWNPAEGRLRDFTNVGYKGGDVPIPDWPVGTSVADFGAKPDDKIDDSEAFLAAIAACPDRHAVFVPKGRYRITKQLRIGRDHFVLRGEDMYETVLWFPKNLTEIYPEVYHDKSYNKGFFYVDGGAGRSIENLTFEFREQIKGDHWEFRGMDAIYYGGGVEESWIRNIYIRNADHGISMGGAKRVSVLNIIFDHFIGRPDTSTVPKDIALFGWVGHVGIGMGKAQNCLFHNIEFKGRYFHDFDIINVPSYNVVSNVKGTEMALHHHGQGANHNLYTNVYAGRGNRDSIGGLRDSQRQQNETHWGIDADLDIDPSMIPMDTKNGHVFVGIGADLDTKVTDTLWYENIDPAKLHPKNIYLAQMEYRKKPLPQGPPPPPPSRSGDVVQLNPVDDNTVDKGKPGTVRNPLDQTLPFDAYLKFDLRDVKLESIERVRLRISAPRIVKTPITLGLSSVADDTWTQDTLTYEKRPEKGELMDSIEVKEDSSDRLLDFDITPFVQAQRKGDQIVSLKLERTDGSGYNGFMRSRENGKAPLLIIEQAASAVPGPPSAPTGMKTTSEKGHILLDWDDSPESDVVTYNVYRRADTKKEIGFGAPIATGLDSSDFVDVDYVENKVTSDMPAGVTFTYVITAVDSHHYESARSAEFTGTALEAKKK